MPNLGEYIQPFRDWLIVALLVGLPMLGLGYWLRRRGERTLFPPQRQRAVPWSGVEVVGTFVLATLVLLFVSDLVKATKLVDHIYGPNAAEADLRALLWAHTLAVPLQVAGILLFLRLLRDTRPYQVGWTPHRLAPNVLIGFLYWLFFTPVVLMIYLLVISGYESLFHMEPEQHPITKLMQASPRPVDWLMTLLTTMVAAPLLEELQFRGVIQGWATQRTLRADYLMAVALTTAVLFRWSGLFGALHQPSASQILLELQPALFVLLLVPVYLYLRGRPSQQETVTIPIEESWEEREPLQEEAIQEAAAVFGVAAQPSPAPPFTLCRPAPVKAKELRSWRGPVAGGVFASALFFAIFHASVWPTPIPLLVLGLVLGWLAYRTQSLVAPMILHGLFNAVAVVSLLHHDTRPLPPPKGSAVTWTDRREPPSSASSHVPGASLPRRR